jgi:hypothetical protein
MLFIVCDSDVNHSSYVDQVVLWNCVCVCVCMCMYVCTYVRVCMYACMCV